MIHPNLEKILKKALGSLDETKILKTATIEFKGNKKGILNYTPFSKYHNDTFADDVHHIEQAYVLDSKGKVIGYVREGYTARYSNGGYDDVKGESIKDALKRLEEKTSAPKYVLVKVQDTEVNGRVINPKLYSKNQPHKCRGFERKNDIKITLYKL